MSNDTNKPGKPRVRILEDAGTETTEGHAQPGKPRIKIPGEDVETDTTEGHIAQPGKPRIRI